MNQNTNEYIKGFTVSMKYVGAPLTAKAAGEFPFTLDDPYFIGRIDGETILRFIRNLENHE